MALGARVQMARRLEPGVLRHVFTPHWRFWQSGSWHLPVIRELSHCFTVSLFGQDSSQGNGPGTWTSLLISEIGAITQDFVTPDVVQVEELLEAAESFISEAERLSQPLLTQQNE